MAPPPMMPPAPPPPPPPPPVMMPPPPRPMSHMVPQGGYAAMAQMPCGDSCSAECAPACSEGKYY